MAETQAPAAPEAAAAQKGKEKTLWFVTLTQSCNLRCTYCGSDETFDVEDLSPHPRELAFDPAALRFLRDETPAPALCFYGGEPLIRTDVIAQVMDMLGDTDIHFVIQTNGTLLQQKFPAQYLKRVGTILLSIDGDEATTDTNRGKGTYAKVLENALWAREHGFTGDFVARMTVGEWSDIDRDVSHLLSLGVFDHVHWQLDVLWDSPMFARWDDFLGWRDKNYNPGISRLVDKTVKALEEEHRVLPIAPFQGLLWSMLRGETVSHVRCSAGHNSFNVATGGIVTACPIAPEFAELARVDQPGFCADVVRESVAIGGRCAKCDVLGMCGGRCLYANKTDWWGDEGFEHVCVTVRHLISELQTKVLPVARRLVDAGLVLVEDFHYPPFNNSVETIP